MRYLITREEADRPIVTLLRFALLHSSTNRPQPLGSLLDHRHSIAASLRFASQLNRSWPIGIAALPVETVTEQSLASRAARSSLDSSQAQSLAAGLASYAFSSAPSGLH